jgi:NAD(P)-dependent dehydrogenase (short-subunit alcohol dehydrogenase family)
MATDSNQTTDVSPLASRTVLITGATGNLGETVARLFLASGSTVFLSGRNKTRLDALQSTLSAAGRVEVVVSDPGTAAGAKALVDECRSRGVVIDVFVHLIGQFAMKTVTEAEASDWQAMMSANAFSAAYVLREILPDMVGHAYGKVIFLSSLAVEHPGIGLGPYAASKVALESLAKTAAEEVRDSGVNVNVVAITTLDTPDGRASMPNVDPSRFIRGEQVADTILFLCSEAAASINGAIIPLIGKGTVSVEL